MVGVAMASPRLLAARSFLTAHTWPLAGAVVGGPGRDWRRANMVCARARFLARPRYLTLAKPHSCLTTRKACSPRARVRERARLIIRQRSLNGRWEVGRRLIR